MKRKSHVSRWLDYLAVLSSHTSVVRVGERFFDTACVHESDIHGHLEIYTTSFGLCQKLFCFKMSYKIVVGDFFVFQNVFYVYGPVKGKVYVSLDFRRFLLIL